MPPLIDLDTVGVTQSKSGQATFENKNDTTSRVTGAYFIPSSFPGVVTSTFPQTVANQSTFKIDFRATPPAAQTYQAKLAVVVDEPCVDTLYSDVEITGSETYRSVKACLSVTTPQGRTPGSFVSLPIAIDNAITDYVGMISLKIIYDPSTFRITGISSNTCKASIFSNDNDAGVLVLNFENCPDSIAAGVIASLEAQLLLTPNVNSNIVVAAVTVTPRSPYIYTTSGCTYPYEADSSCIAPSSLRLRTKARPTLQQNIPNPFSESTTISFSLASEDAVDLSVYDMFGRKVRTLVSGEVVRGNHDIKVETKDLPNGTYLYQLRSGPFILAKKMVVAK